ncbi:DUF2889 domain-containing protein [Roseomonas sp. KE0001]|uniref:DUF2889 domain-containing protein n=1 Tax=unclassified Roseomonas TaxID=2617492 RepID=UPI0018DEF5D8|nr:DUF2889 domain-containing protein [Roseomonas sp. KE0001]MBI0434254.1 DUF2889 domain-containing protein [Roseomonas sp. KE0001]
MPLSPPAARKPLHRRQIDMHGFEREDGLFDIEGHLTDTKSFPFDSLDRRVEPGEALHGMWIRLTIDAEMVIQSCEAATDFSPYAICPQAAPNFARLAGLRIGPGFNRAVQERVGGTVGCTHLREMLAQMATVAFQTSYARRRAARQEAGRDGRKPAQIGTCLAYAEDSPVVARHWPAYVAGRKAAE